MASRLQQLEQLKSQVPGGDVQTTDRAKAARVALLQQQLGALPAQQPVPKVAQQLAAQQTQMAQQAQGEQVQRQQQSAATVGQMALQQKEQAGQMSLQRQATAQETIQQTAKNTMAQRLQQESLDSRKRMDQSDIDANNRLQAAGFDVDSKLQFATQQQRKELAKLGNDVKAQLIDSRLAFEKDDQGRKFSNERQMADYIAANSKSQQEFEQRMSQMTQLAQQKAVVLSGVRDRLATILKQGYIDKEGDMDRETQLEITQLQAAAQKEATDAENKAKNNQARTSSIGAILGGIIGGVAAGSVTGGMGAGAGVAAGASIGGAATTALSGLTG